jgi:hypothetical protein
MFYPLAEAGRETLTPISLQKFAGSRRAVCITSEADTGMHYFSRSHGVCPTLSRFIPDGQCPEHQRFMLCLVLGIQRDALIINFQESGPKGLR